MKRTHTLAAVAALCLGLAPVSAHAYSALYAFGDSLSDAGNVFLATTAPHSPYPAQPVPPYYNGEFSNGPIWIEDLSQSLGLGPLIPSSVGGTDYAYGGATTGYTATLTSPTLVPTLAQQVGSFLIATGGHAPSSALYSIWIGSNDLFNIVESGTTPTAAIGEAQQAALIEAKAIEALATAGATKFLVPLVGDLGTTPTLTLFGKSASAAGTALAMIYDAALEADLAGLSATPGISLSVLDTFTLLDSAIADRSAFGLTDISDPCYVGAYTGGGTVCATPATYLFWDDLHPTATGQAIIARAAYDVVPEPATFAVFGTALVGIATLRRKRRSAAVR